MLGTINAMRLAEIVTTDAAMAAVALGYHAATHETLLDHGIVHEVADDVTVAVNHRAEILRLARIPRISLEDGSCAIFAALESMLTQTMMLETSDDDDDGIVHVISEEMPRMLEITFNPNRSRAATRALMRARTNPANRTAALVVVYEDSRLDERDGQDDGAWSCEFIAQLASHAGHVIADIPAPCKIRDGGCDVWWASALIHVADASLARADVHMIHKVDDTTSPSPLAQAVLQTILARNGRMDIQRYADANERESVLAAQ